MSTDTQSTVIGGKVEEVIDIAVSEAQHSHFSIDGFRVNVLLGRKDPISLMRFRELFYSGCDSFEFDPDKSEKRKYFDLSKWHNGNYFHPPISLDCSDAIKALSESPLNVHNLVLAIYRSEVPDVLARIDPKLMLELRKTLVQIRSFLDIGVSLCDKDRNGLTITDVCRLIEGIPQACEDADFEIKHDLDYKRSNIKIEQKITKKEQTRAKRVIDLVCNAAFKSGNSQLPDVVLKLEIPIKCFSAQTKLVVQDYQKANFVSSDLQVEDAGSMFFESIFIAVVLEGVTNLNCNPVGLPANDDILNAIPKGTVAITKGAEGELTLHDLNADWVNVTHIRNNGALFIHKAVDEGTHLSLSDGFFVTETAAAASGTDETTASE
jgi:hypothetical protein